MNKTNVVAYIGVGSNINPEENIARAFEALSDAVEVTGFSRFYKSTALGRPGDPWFVNGVFQIVTDASPHRLKFSILRRIETDLGRVRTEDPYSPRTIDLDILLYGDLVVDEPGLHIPDPDIHTRSFITVPLCELNPDLELPDTGEPVSSLVRCRSFMELEEVPTVFAQLNERALRERTASSRSTP